MKMTLYHIILIGFIVISFMILKYRPVESAARSQHIVKSLNSDEIDEIIFTLKNPMNTENADSNLERVGPMCTDIVMRVHAVSRLLKNKKNVIYLYSPSDEYFAELDHKLIDTIWKQYVKTDRYVREGDLIRERLSRQISIFTEAQFVPVLNIVCSHGEDYDMFLINKKRIKDIANQHSVSYEDALKSFLKSLHKRPIVAFAQSLHDILSGLQTSYVELKL